MTMTTTNHEANTVAAARATFATKRKSLDKSKGKYFIRLRAQLAAADALLSYLSDDASVVTALTHFAPSAVDVLTEVAENAAFDAFMRFKREEANAKSKRPYVGCTFKNVEEQVSYAKARLELASAACEPFSAEYRSRPWKRYFLVVNSNGHIHSGRSCKQCFPTTSYSWLAELSGCDETEMVAEYGETACTVCFPDAPTMEGWGKIAAAEKAKFCEHSGSYADLTPRENTSAMHGGYVYKTCECGYAGAITKTGKFRKHKKATK